MTSKGAKYLFCVMATACMVGCSVTKHLPPDAYMLTRNTIETDRSVPRKERISSGEIESYVRQDPPRKLLGTNIPVWLYNQADPAKTNGWNNLLRRLGSEPVILDTALTRLSAQNIGLYTNTRGFYESESGYNIRYKRNRKAVVTYNVRQGRPQRIDSIGYEYHDDFLEQVIRQDSTATLVHRGDIFDINVLGQERNRISTILKNRGYYNFSINNIGFIADTTAGDHLVNLTMVVKQHLGSYDARGEAVMENNAIYRLREIYVFPDYDATRAATDSTYLRNLDTLNYQGLKIVSAGKPKVTPQTLRRAIPLYPDYVYSHADIRRTSGSLLRMEYFKSANILFSEAPAREDNFVTYVGWDDDAAQQGPAQTAEKALVCNILCTPALRQGYTLDFEATTSSSFYALMPAISYHNRNLLRGAELFDVSLMGGVEFYKGAASGSSSSYEIGASTSVTFPRFFTPFSIDRGGKLFRPQTRIALQASLQRRPVYHRVITGGSLGYTWGNGRHGTYTLRPLDVNVVKVNYLSEDFINNIRNEYLRASYQSQFIAAVSASYVYNNPMTAAGNSLVFRWNAEAAGNFSYLLSSLFSEPETATVGETEKEMRQETFHNLFGIRFSQYFRTDLTFSKKHTLGNKTALAWRLFGGIGIPYGNSSTLPIDRFFYAGGSNSMRGWVVRTLGPGGSTVDSVDGFNSQRGNLRLEANAEFRFPVWSALGGAVFLDMGNVWMAGLRGAASEEEFRFDTFYKQLGLNTGLGIRLDFDIAVVRLDWGVKLHDPGKPSGERWFTSLRMRDTAFNFGIGYPF